MVADLASRSFSSLQGLSSARTLSLRTSHTSDRVNFHDTGEATVVEAEEFSLANCVASRPGDFSRRLVEHVFFFPRIGNLIDD